VQQAGCLAEMKLPANTVGDPHAIFDSTGLVFAVTAAMSGGAGNVSSLQIPSLGAQHRGVYSRYSNKLRSSLRTILYSPRSSIVWMLVIAYAAVVVVVVVTYAYVVYSFV
jgi:hypothetical protein